VKTIVWFCLFPALLLAKSALYETGKQLYFAKGCNGCHGIKAEGMNEYPLLANRAKGYLANKIKRFRQGLSDNQQQELMIGFARGLSDEEIDALTTYLNEFEDEQTQRYDIPFESWGDGGS